MVDGGGQITLEGEVVGSMNERLVNFMKGRMAKVMGDAPYSSA